MTRTLRVVVGVAMLMAGLAVPARAAAVQARVEVGGSCVNADGSPFPDEMRLKDKDGALKEAALLVDMIGYVQGCFSEAVILPTDRLTFRAAGQILETIVIPKVTVSANRATDVVEGAAPAGSTVSVRTKTCDAFDGCSTVTDGDVVAGGDGSWVRPVNVVHDLKGFDRIHASILIDDDWFEANARVPYLEVTVGKATVKGATRSKGSVTTRLIRGGSERARFTKAADPVGAFSGKLRKSGSDVAVANGDRVKANLVPPVTLDVEIRMTINKRTDTIGGHCAPGGSYGVMLRDPDTGSSHRTEGLLDDDGDVVEDAFELSDKVGWAVTFICRRPSGDRAIRIATIP